MENTGIDALELNLYSVPKKFELTGQDYEKHQLEIIKRVKKAIKIPVSIKLSPFYSNTLNFINEADKLGVNSFVLFNKLYEPEIDINEETPLFPFNLSNKGDYRMSLRYAGLLYGNVKGDISSASGIFDGYDAIKLLLAGANTVQVVSTLYKNKISHVSTMLKQIEDWMDKKGYKTMDDFRGKLSRKNMKDPFVYLRAQYVDILLNSTDQLLKKNPVV